MNQEQQANAKKKKKKNCVPLRLTPLTIRGCNHSRFVKFKTITLIYLTLYVRMDIEFTRLTELTFNLEESMGSPAMQAEELCAVPLFCNA